MERNTEKLQKPLLADGKNDVKIQRGYDAKLFESIMKKSGSPSLAKNYAYLRSAKYYAKNKFYAEHIEDKAFCAGTIGKKHFRLVDIAIVEDEHGKGYGRILMQRLIRRCKKYGLEKITFRVNIQEGAAEFYKKFGAKVTGIKDKTDYEMEIIL